MNAQKLPESREFWGWWLKLTPKKGGFEYAYTFGKFNTEGNWKMDHVPKRCTKEVTKSLEMFYKKISNFVENELQLEITALSSLKHPQLGPAA
ncbi:Curlin genes transcriptional activator [Candidatus Enterovibrio altilux]|uniref:Curlin genes transcriptional activator n=1 Tax=Candidatus Enterovibrio altilux TaxID=1927128 RepID=A0A291B6H6_9GAMM|nr:Curlin genes transcriptional activator [Candidatus Enterovibrio luxaltus]